MKSSLTLSIPHTALLIIDMQEENRHDDRYLVAGFPDVLTNTRRVLDAARVVGIPVLNAAFVRDFAIEEPRPFEPVAEDGTPTFSAGETPLTAVCHEVAPLPGETSFTKQDSSCFTNPMLDLNLTKAGTEWLIICGVWTEYCVSATVRDAQARGLRVLLVKDACGSGTAAMHQSAVIALANHLYGGAVVDTPTACILLKGQAAPAWRCTTPVPLRFDPHTLADVYHAL